MKVKAIEFKRTVSKQRKILDLTGDLDSGTIRAEPSAASLARRTSSAQAAAELYVASQLGEVLSDEAIEEMREHVTHYDEARKALAKLR